MPINSLASIVGNNIANQRKRLGLTQKELADKLGIATDSVAHMEQGIHAPKMARLQDIAKILQCSVPYLFHDENEHLESMTNERAEMIAEMLQTVSPQAQETILDLVTHSVQVMKYR